MSELCDHIVDLVACHLLGSSKDQKPGNISNPIVA